MTKLDPKQSKTCSKSEARRCRGFAYLAGTKVGGGRNHVTLNSFCLRTAPEDIHTDFGSSQNK